MGTDAQIAIPGIIVSGSTSKRLLLRAIGPGLAPFGVTAFLADPLLTLVDANNRIVATNDDWFLTPDLATLRLTTATVGAFALPAASRDAALLITLAPGSYTALVTGAANTTGVALVEVYEVP